MSVKICLLENALTGGLITGGGGLQSNEERKGRVGRAGVMVFELGTKRSLTQTFR